ncbi:MAG TPA: hypothetical protein VFP59_07300 [Candidatus Angelobacter sp.]|nr:hypothetical protein [Candidatus Angelobacter sp.]
MKALLRSSIVALIVFAGYSTFSMSNLQMGHAGPYTPTCAPVPSASLCVK